MRYASRDGKRWEEKSFQDIFLQHLYESIWGRIVLKVLIHPWISRMGGAFLNTSISKILIAPFVKSHNLFPEQWEKKEFTSYNDFFTRRLKEECRPITLEKECFISPCDGKLTVYPIEKNGRFHIKHTGYTIHSLLRNKKLAQRYQEGYALVFRLTVDDYHRYCYVADGVKSSNYHIPGVFHTVNPIANDVEPIYKENTREYTLIHTENFGTVLQMEVGAMMVGKIHNYHGAGSIKRGQEKGRFEFGGSTIVLLVEQGKLSIDCDIMKNSKDGYETIVRMGETIGKKNE